MDKHIDKLIEDSATRTLSNSEEKKIYDYLKSIPESDAYEIINEMLENKSLVTIAIAKKILNDKKNIIIFFEHGLKTTNAQSIKAWLNFAIPKIGFKAVVNSMISINNHENKIIEKALYWLPSIITETNEKSQDLLQQLKNHINKEDIV
jgi:hypothetical protein